MVVPLDWGLGHATRCIPLIRELEARGCNVLIAAEAATQSLLQHEFQHLTFIRLRGYRISYSRTKRWLPLVILGQVPILLYNIYQEHRWLKKIVKKYGIDGILSDNRFGLHHPAVPCVYITHQLLIKTGNSFTEKIAQRIHARFIKKYSACWVPDFEGDQNLAGVLSHPLHYPDNVKYIGCLSRFKKKPAVLTRHQLLILISGPEPQRSIFENCLLKQLKNFSGSVLLVRGLPGLVNDTSDVIDNNKNLSIQNHLDAAALNEAIQSAEMVICRSGYTTVMDLVKLQQKAILVPTPGQTEQEYLAEHLMAQGLFFTMPQDGFVLSAALSKAAQFSYQIPLYDMEQYKKAITGFIGSL